MKMEWKVNTRNAFKQVANATVADVSAGLYLVAEEIMTDAKMHYVPVVTGALRRSGFVEKGVVTGNTVTVKLGFGGSATPYALAVHEYPAHYGQGKNKYLLRPIQAAVPTLANRLAEHVRARQAMLSRTIKV